MKIKLLSVICAAALCACLTGCGAEKTGNGLNAGIKKIDVEWNTGKVIVAAEEREDIDLYTIAGDKRQKPAFHCNGDHLIIENDAESGGELNIAVPDSMLFDEIEIRTGSADVFVNGVNGDRLDVVTESGNTLVRGCAFTEMAEISSESGDVNMRGEAGDFDLESLKGNVFFDCTSAPADGEMETDSGLLRLTLPDDTGFTAVFHTDSGSLRSDFELKQRGSKYTFGSGRCTYRLDTKTGFAEIRASEAK